MEQASSRGHEASPQGGLGVGCKLCFSSKKLRELNVRVQARRISISLSLSVAGVSSFQSIGQEHPLQSSANGGVGKVPPGGGYVSEKRGDLRADAASGVRGACAVQGQGGIFVHIPDWAVGAPVLGGKKKSSRTPFFSLQVRSRRPN